MEEARPVDTTRRRLLDVAAQLEEEQAQRERWHAQREAELLERADAAERERGELRLLVAWVRKERDKMASENAELRRALDAARAESGEGERVRELTCELLQTRFALADLAAAADPGPERSRADGADKENVGPNARPRAAPPQGARWAASALHGCSRDALLASARGADVRRITELLWPTARLAAAGDAPAAAAAAAAAEAGANAAGTPPLAETLGAALRALLARYAAPGDDDDDEYLPPDVARVCDALIDLGAELDGTAGVRAADDDDDDDDGGGGGGGSDDEQQRRRVAGARARGGAGGPGAGRLQPLLHAVVAAGGAPAALGFALRAGASVDALDAAGRTALHVAVETGRAAAARALVEAGASILARDGRGRTAEQAAAALDGAAAPPLAPASDGEAPPPSSVGAVFADGSLIFWSLVRTANALYKDGQFAAARAQYAEILSRARRGALELHIDDANLATIHYNWARAAYKDGLHCEALEHCERALEHQPGYSNALAQRAQCQMELLDYDGATSTYEQLTRAAAAAAVAASPLGGGAGASSPAHGSAAMAEWAELHAHARALRDADPCEVLSLDAAALGPPLDESALKRAYRAAALRWHPDKHTASAEAGARALNAFQRVSAAHALLSDDVQRAEYVARARAFAEPRMPPPPQAPPAPPAHAAAGCSASPGGAGARGGGAHYDFGGAPQAPPAHAAAGCSASPGGAGARGGAHYDFGGGAGGARGTRAEDGLGAGRGADAPRSAEAARAGGARFSTPSRTTPARPPRAATHHRAAFGAASGGGAGAAAYDGRQAYASSPPPMATPPRESPLKPAYASRAQQHAAAAAAAYDDVPLPTPRSAARRTSGGAHYNAHAPPQPAFDFV